MKLTNKKKQHCVPQMIQRRFSNDGKRVSGWDIRDRRLYENIPIKGQLQEKYFYERTEDGFERTLENLEDKAKPLFDEIEELKRIPPKDMRSGRFLSYGQWYKSREQMYWRILSTNFVKR